ncbi:MAG: RNA methyltransferase [Spirochaetales bacterium]|nr:RNA methyltransferase [Spirochaetales bacterium]
MNLLVLEPDEVGERLPRSDRRVEHVRKILRKKAGDLLAAGISGGPDGPAPLGSATVEELDEKGARFSFTPEREAPPLRPLVLLLGLPRPIQANRILKDLSSLGLARIVLCGTELGEKSYANSDLYLKGDFRRPLLEGAEQAGNPRLPEVSTSPSLKAALRELAGFPGARIALDPYRSAGPLGAWLPEPGDNSALLAIGSERGWTTYELDELEGARFGCRDLGDRILKTETAAVAAAAIVLSRLGFL